MPHVDKTDSLTVRNVTVAVLVVLLLMYASLRVGLHIGARKVLDVFVDQDVGTAATEANIRVKALGMLRAGENGKAEELLENLIDSDLGFLGVNAGNRSVKEREKILAAIKAAKEYREKYPGHRVSPRMSAGVARAFALVDK